MSHPVVVLPASADAVVLHAVGQTDRRRDEGTVVHPHAVGQEHAAVDGDAQMSRIEELVDVEPHAEAVPKKGAA